MAQICQKPISNRVHQAWVCVQESPELQYKEEVQAAGIQIRRAVDADVPMVAAVWHAGWHEDPGTRGTDGLPADFLKERTLNAFEPRAIARVPQCSQPTD